MTNLSSAVRKELEDIPVDRFCSEYIFERTPYVFGGNWRGYLEWKSELARLIEVDAHNLRIVGSAAVGVSLSPMKNLKPFDDESDIDVAVLSAYRFDVAWRTLRSMSKSKILALPKKQRKAINGHIQAHVFRGTITTDNTLQLLPFNRDWMEALQLMAHRDPTMDRTINIRLYRDADSLRAYQVDGLKQLRETLLSTGESEGERLS